MDKKENTTRFNHNRPGDRWRGLSSSRFYLQAARLIVSVFGFTFSLTCLYLAMRGVMRLGGFVASGGPYAIEHPAPGWTWIVPVSIFLGLFFVLLNVFSRSQLGTANLLILAWPALFCSLGWNFLEFGIHPPGGGGLAWGWLVCAVLFMVMGGVPLIIVIRIMFKDLRGGILSFLFAPWTQVIDGKEERPSFLVSKKVRIILILLQLAAVGLGIAGGARFFRGISEAKRASVTAKSTGNS